MQWALSRIWHEYWSTIFTGVFVAVDGKKQIIRLVQGGVGADEGMGEGSLAVCLGLLPWLGWEKRDDRVWYMRSRTKIDIILRIGL